MAAFDGVEASLTGTFGESATLESTGSRDRRAITAILYTQPEGSTESARAWVLQSSLPVRPQRGDIVEHRDTRYSIVTAESDERYWILGLRTVALMR